VTPVTARVAETSADIAAAYAVRSRVFVDGQRVPVEIERDGADAAAVHVVGLLDGTVVGAGRLVDRRDGVGVIGRLAVLPAARRHGVATAVLRELEAAAVERGVRRLDLHAQLSARAFWDRHGYTAYGAEFVEAGIRHVAMRRVLAGGPSGPGGPGGEGGPSGPGGPGGPSGPGGPGGEG
jgi:predicted GNAT family N-acyltransferase